ncbi:MAG: DUF7482 domain-containing protein [Gaiellaceae bacterium]
MQPQGSIATVRLDRGELLRRATGVVAVGTLGPTLLAACGGSGDEAAPSESGVGTATLEEAAERARPIIGDVVDFSLESDEWDGDFGFVTMRLHGGRVDGSDVYFIRTDVSDEGFADAERLVFVPKLAALATPKLSGAVYVDRVAADRPAIFSSEPGREAYTPAWRVHYLRWSNGPRELASVAEIQEAKRAGALMVEDSGFVLNAAIIKWSTGELAVDRERKGYLGEGPLLEPPDTGAMRVTFKLGQCYPGSRYFVTEHSIAPAAAMTKTIFSPGLQGGPSEAGATGRTNVFMNGLPGPGPMGFQPSVFDFDAGAPEWSPYWDHFTYGWADDAEARLLTSEKEIHAARDGGELDEFPGMPDTKGTVFTVNCPVPVLAPPTFVA